MNSALFSCRFRLDPSASKPEQKRTGAMLRMLHAGIPGMLWQTASCSLCQSQG